MNEDQPPVWSQVTAPVPDPNPAPSEPPRTHGRRWLIAAGVIVALLVLGGTWVLLNGDNSDSSDTTASATSGEDALADQLVDAFTLTTGEARCVLDRARDHMSDDQISQLITNPEPGDNPKAGDQDVLDQTITGCSLSESTGTSRDAKSEGQPVGPYTYGDDTELDRLWDQCSKDGTAVCDELFNKAPEGSEYEAFADTCGGRGAPQVACAPDALAEAGSTPEAQTGPSEKRGDNAELDRLWDDCAKGDPQACLTLAFQAPAGSEYAEFGASCGNRPEDDRCKQSG